MSEIKICVVGLGYVGLPLALSLSEYFEVVGVDNNICRLETINRSIDPNGEIDFRSYSTDRRFKAVSEMAECKNCNFFIVTVPTPIDQTMTPDLEPLRSASKQIGEVLKPYDIVVYESTVFPGCTEEECVPILEQASDLVFNRDFFVGYSPERVSPGTNQKDLRDIAKIVSASNEETLNRVNSVYSKIIRAELHNASSIRVAELAKVYENVQRDVNIALANEIQLICEANQISYDDVLNAASTKWNFNNYRPGFVGGHCIGVDPYYLIEHSRRRGINLKVVTTARNRNEEFIEHTAKRIVKKSIEENKTTVVILGRTFKENCADDRNSGAKKIIQYIENARLKCISYDPYLDEVPISSFFNSLNLNDCFVVRLVNHSVFERYLDNEGSKFKSVIHDAP